MAELEWIKCSDRLPEKEGQYLVVTFDYHGTYEKHLGTMLADFVFDLSTVDEMEFGPEERPGWYEYFPDYYNESSSFTEIKALYWMPFPEPPNLNEEDVVRLYFA